MKTNIKFRLIVFSFLLLINCTDPYQPPVTANAVNILVVDGYLNSSDSSAQVILSRAEQLSSSSTPAAESNAQVSLKDDQGTLYGLAEGVAGTYSLKIIIDTQRKYQLTIQTSDGKKYSSDFVAIEKPLPIDSVTWGSTKDGVSIYVNTHDPTGGAKYYRWVIEETWQYSSAYPSYYILTDTGIIPRPPSEQINTCWSTVPSSKIFLFSTKRLSQDVVNQFQLSFLSIGSVQLSEEYSILVKQQILSEEGYNFWLQLQKTTDNVGGLFDQLPTQVIGNIHSATDSSEAVMGFFSGGSITENRFFLRYKELPAYLQVPQYYQCVLDSIPLDKIRYLSNTELLIDWYGGLFPEGYTSSIYPCIDCRLAGGVATKPSFWK